MTTIAFTFSTNDFEYVALTGTKANPKLHSKGKILLPANYNIPQTVAWFENELELLLNSIQPDNVSYRLTVMKVTNSYVSNVYYGQGILNLLCHKKNIQISHTSPSSITANTSFYDDAVRNYRFRKGSYVAAHHSPEEERVIMEKVYRDLPIVKRANISPKNPDTLQITIYRGETINIGLKRLRRKGIASVTTAPTTSLSTTEKN